MRYTFLFLLCITLAFACKTDNSSSVNVEEQGPVDMEQLEASLETTSDEKVDVEVKMDEVIDQNELAKKLIVESKSEEVAAEVKVEDKTDVKLKGKTEEQKKKEAQLKMESTKEIIDSSPNKGLTCEQILEEQRKFVSDFDSSKDKKIILAMAKKQNDPFFKECLTQPSFQEEIDNLAMKLEEIMDKM